MAECVISPGPWEGRGAPIDTLAQETRAALGLTVDTPLVVSGHQPTAPHPGILAKYIAADAWASAAGATTCHLVIDTAAAAIATIDVPVGHAPESLTSSPVSLAIESTGPLMTRAAATPSQSTIDTSLVWSDTGLATLRDAWEAAPDDQGAAPQAAWVVASVCSPWVKPATVVFASSLLSTPTGSALVDAMRRDPAACVHAYNDAAGHVPKGGVTQLQTGSDPELPLWVVADDGLRPAHASDLNKAITLAPRALVTTAIMRSIADLFIHGTGGMAYDQVMEAWVASWNPLSLSPRVLATATLRLPLGEEADFQQACDHAIAQHRRATHDPAASGHAPSPAKQRLLDEIARHDRGTPGRQAAFDALHALVDSHRDAGEDEAHHQHVHAIKLGQDIAARRTWAAVLHNPSAIDALADDCRTQVSAVSVPRSARSTPPSRRQPCR